MEGLMKNIMFFVVVSVIFCSIKAEEDQELLTPAQVKAASSPESIAKHKQHGEGLGYTWSNGKKVDQHQAYNCCPDPNNSKKTVCYQK